MVSRKYYYDIDLNGNSLVNAAVESVTGELPENAKMGSIIYRTDDDTIYQKLKDGWKPISSTDKSSISDILKNIEDLSKTAQETAEILETKADKSDLVSLYRAKGSVASYKDLPETAEIGDVYDALDTSMNYVWTGDRWDELGAIGDNMDLSNFYTKSETDSALSNKVSKSGDQTIDGVKTFTSPITGNLANVDYTSAVTARADMATLKAYNNSGNVHIFRNPDGTGAELKIRNKNSTWRALTLMNLDNGDSYALAPTPSDTSDNSDKIATTSWINNIDNDVVHKTRNEMIAGNKSFTGLTTFASAPKINTWLQLLPTPSETVWTKIATFSKEINVVQRYCALVEINTPYHKQSGLLRIWKSNASGASSIGAEWIYCIGYSTEDFAIHLTPDYIATFWIRQGTSRTAMNVRCVSQCDIYGVDRTDAWVFHDADADGKRETLTALPTDGFIVYSTPMTVPTPSNDATGTEVVNADWSIGKFVQKSGDTMTGSLTIAGTGYNSLNLKSPDGEVATTQTANDMAIRFRDKNDTAMGGIYSNISSAHVTYIDLRAITKKADGSLFQPAITLRAYPDGTSRATAPTPPDASDNSVRIATTAWVNSADSVVHKTGNETVAGTKTFSNAPLVKGGRIRCINPNLPSQSAPTSYQYEQGIIFQDVAYKEVGAVFHQVAKNSTTGETHITSISNGANRKEVRLSVFSPDGGGGYATAPTTPSDATSNEIATADWVNTKLATKQDTMSAGTGIALDGATINHSNSVTANTSGVGSTTKVPVIKYDAQGHITSCTTATIYPPTSVGTSGQYWKSDGSGTGAWQTLASAPASGSAVAISAGAVFTALEDKADLASAITGLSVSGKVITYTKGDGSTGTITTQDTNTDTKVKQSIATGNVNRALLLSYVNNSDSTTDVTNQCYRNNTIYANPSTGIITATGFAGALTGNVTGNCSGSSGSCTGNAATATKATQDSAGQQINTTYIKGLSVSGKVITYTKGDGTTGTITTQDSNTTYSAGTGISISSNKINHSNSVTANTSGVGSATAVPIIKYDAQGHITAVTTATIYPPTSAGAAGQIWVSDGSGAGAWKHKITMSTSDPSGGANGDIWFKYE